MMRGPTYDDEYISRKMNTLQSAPTYGPPAPSYNYQGYSPAPRLPPRMGPPPAPYYDYDYGYGGGYGGYGGYGGGYGGYRPYGGYGYGYPAPPPPPPRYRSYDPYVEEDYDLSYVPRYRPTRYSDTLVDLEKNKLGGEGVSISRKSTTTSQPRTLERRALRNSLDSEGDQPTTGRRRYQALSEPQMLQDQVDKMRTRLQAMTFSLDPSGPVPEIIIPERSRRVDSGRDFSKKYTSALEMTELPRLSARKHHTYVEDEYMKDNLRIKCLSHYKTTRTAAEYWKPKGYYGDETSSYSLPSYSSKYSRSKTAAEAGARWEEPDTVYSSSSKELKENKAFSKSSEGDDDELRRDRFKKKRSKERDEPLAIESQAAPIVPDSPAETPAAAAPAEEASAPADVAPSAEVTESAAAAPPSAEEAELDEKEKKRLEKKKRKAEREAAAKAAMEAELAALAEAEAELARLEAESSSLKAPAETKADDATKVADDKPSETPAEK